jgi:hypothetical protein
VPSAQLSIVETALEEILAKLAELPPGDVASELAARAARLDRALDAWLLAAPTEERRREVVNEVLDLAVAVTRHHAVIDAEERSKPALGTLAPSDHPVPVESDWRVVRGEPITVPLLRASGEGKRPRRGGK